MKTEPRIPSIIEAPDDETIASLVLSAAGAGIGARSMGNLHRATLRAFTLDEFLDFLRKI